MCLCRASPVVNTKPLCLCAALQVLRSSCPTSWRGRCPSSGRWRCTPGSAPSSATSSSLPTPSSRTPPCHPTRPPTRSHSWRKLAGGWKRRRKGLGNSPLSKGMVIRCGCVCKGWERLLCSEGWPCPLLWSAACREVREICLSPSDMVVQMPKAILRQWACDVWVGRLEMLLAGWEGAGQREHM